jgi:hypothetical protein
MIFLFSDGEESEAREITLVQWEDGRSSSQQALFGCWQFRSRNNGVRVLAERRNASLHHAVSLQHGSPSLPV